MRYAYLRLSVALGIATGCELFVATAQAPLAYLPLTCSSASAIGQPQNNCAGDWAYSAPTSDQLIVLRSNGTWARAADLGNTDGLAVCALPVQPGTYSSCKDAAGVRRIFYPFKVSVFDSSTPPPSIGTQILDLSRVPVEITVPGLYVLNRNWVTFARQEAILVTADNVTLDLQGFELSNDAAAIVSTGRNVTIRNGRVVAESGSAIQVSGAGTFIDRVRVRMTHGRAVTLGGTGSTLTDSIISVSGSGTGVHAEDDTIVRDNQITAGVNPALIASSRTTVADNQIGGCAIDPCMSVGGVENIVSGNKISVLSGRYGEGLLVGGDHNEVLNNVVTGCSLDAAIIVTGQRNTFRGNSVPSCGSNSVGQTGIRFDRDGNFYGDNIVCGQSYPSTWAPPRKRTWAAT